MTNRRSGGDHDACRFASGAPSLPEALHTLKLSRRHVTPGPRGRVPVAAE
jgi:hypothetical protein